MDLEIYREILDRLAEETDEIVQLTTCGSPRLTVQERLNRVSGARARLDQHGLQFLIRCELVFFPTTGMSSGTCAWKVSPTAPRQGPRFASRARGLTPGLGLVGPLVKREASRSLADNVWCIMRRVA